MDVSTPSQAILELMSWKIFKKRAYHERAFRTTEENFWMQAVKSYLFYGLNVESGVSL